MTRIKIKKFVPKTVFKAAFFVSAIPVLLLIILSIVRFAVGMTLNEGQSLLLTILYFAFSPLAYGLVMMLFAVIYNWLASTFGGLEIEIDEAGNEVVGNNRNL